MLQQLLGGGGSARGLASFSLALGADLHKASFPF